MAKQDTKRSASHRGLHPNPHTLGVEPLAKGEATRVVRVRGKARAVDAFADLTAAERGELVERWIEK